MNDAMIEAMSQFEIPRPIQRRSAGNHFWMFDLSMHIALGGRMERRLPFLDFSRNRDQLCPATTSLLSTP